MFALSSEVCIVQVLEGAKNLSALRNSEVSAFGTIPKYSINNAFTGLHQVAVQARLPLFREVSIKGS